MNNNKQTNTQTNKQKTPLHRAFCEREKSEGPVYCRVFRRYSVSMVSLTDSLGKHIDSSYP